MKTPEEANSDERQELKPPKIRWPARVILFLMALFVSAMCLGKGLAETIGFGRTIDFLFAGGFAVLGVVALLATGMRQGSLTKPTPKQVWRTVAIQLFATFIGYLLAFLLAWYFFK